MGLETYDPGVDYTKKAESKKFDPYSVYGASRSAEYKSKNTGYDRDAINRAASLAVNPGSKYAYGDTGSGSGGNIGNVETVAGGIQAIDDLYPNYNVGSSEYIDSWRTGSGTTGATPNISPRTLGQAYNTINDSQTQSRPGGGGGTVATNSRAGGYDDFDTGYGETPYYGPGAYGPSPSGDFDEVYVPPSATSGSGYADTSGYTDPWAYSGGDVDYEGDSPAVYRPPGAPAPPSVPYQGVNPPGETYTSPGPSTSAAPTTSAAPKKTAVETGSTQTQTISRAPQTTTVTSAKTPKGPAPAQREPEPLTIPERPPSPEMEETEMGSTPAYIAPDVEARPELVAPEYDKNEISRRQQEIAAPGVRQLREMYGTIRAAARGGDPQRRLTLKESMKGYSEGLSKVMGGARTQAAQEYEAQYAKSYDTAVQNWESTIGEQRDRLTLQTGQAKLNWEAAVRSVEKRYEGQMETRKAEFEAEVEAVNTMYKAEVQAEQVRYAEDSRRMAAAYESAWRGYLGTMGESTTTSAGSLDETRISGTTRQWTLLP